MSATRAAEPELTLGVLGAVIVGCRTKRATAGARSVNDGSAVKLVSSAAWADVDNYVDGFAWPRAEPDLVIEIVSPEFDCQNLRSHANKPDAVDHERRRPPPQGLERCCQASMDFRSRPTAG
jgi:hypothetical protein